MADVIFKYGTRAEYDSIKANALQNALYFLLDTGELYRGQVPIVQNHVFFTEVQENETVAAAQVRAIGEQTPVIGDFLLLNTGNSNLVYIYANDEDAWLMLTPNTITAESIVFENGDTLTEVLEDLDVDVTADEITVEHNVDGDLAIKDFGVRYYRFVPAVEAEGEEGEDGYVPAVEAHYELQEVDTTHPWKAGLELRSTALGIGWYEQNSDTIDGLQGIVAALESRVAAAEQAIASKAGVFHFKGVLTLEEGETISEALANIENPVDGDVYQAGDSEYVYTTEGEWVELGSNVDLSYYAPVSMLEDLQEDVGLVQVNVASLSELIGTPADGENEATGLYAIINNAVRIFTNEEDGMVPAPHFESGTDATRYFLDASGNWTELAIQWSPIIDN